MTDNLVGFELLLHSAKQDIKKKEDVILLLVHHSLLKAGFKCAGNGEIWNDNDVPSELLPNGWNASKDYTLRYKRDADNFVLMSNRTNDVIVLNFTAPEKMKVSNLIFNIEESVISLDGCISDMVPKYNDMIQKIVQELVTPFATVQKVDTNTQTADQPSKVEVRHTPDPLRSDSMRSDVRDRLVHDINAVGRRDLDPLAGGGGMLFDPLRGNRRRLPEDLGHPYHLPRGAIPPGARFDPFGPPDHNNIRGRPPPDYDDMFS